MVLFPRALGSLLLLVTIFNGEALGGPFPQQQHERRGAPVLDPDHNGGVASESYDCSKKGKTIFAAGGNAVDVAVATAFCVGVVAGYHSGIGGGGFMLVRDPSGSYEAIDFRETAPEAATEDMYKDNVTASIFGGLSIAVPGEVAGLYYAHKKYGRLSWKLLLEDSIYLAKKGFKVNEDMDRYFTASVTGSSYNFLAEQEDWAKDYRIQGELASVGRKITRTKLAETLQKIADEGPDAFYKGPVAEDMVETIRDAGGIITLEDFENYKVQSRPVLKMNFATYGFQSEDEKQWLKQQKKMIKKLKRKNRKGVKPDPKPKIPFEASQKKEEFALYGVGAPASSSIAFAILRVMDNFAREWANLQDDEKKKKKEPKMMAHHWVEAMKFAYAMRMHLADPDYVEGMEALQAKIISNDTAWDIYNRIDPRGPLPLDQYDQQLVYVGDDHGTAQISTMDREGFAVSLTTTINLLWGSQVICPKTGVIFNNEMNDFSIPGKPNEFGFEPAESNFIKPGKRPLSSISPIIVEALDDDGNPRLFVAVGAAGGSRIISATAQTVFHMLHDGNSPRMAIANGRLHDQLLPQMLLVEKNAPVAIVEYLKSLGHNVTWVPQGLSAVHAVTRNRESGRFEATSDNRQQNAGGQTY